MVESTGLENRRGLTTSQGSNPCSSAINQKGSQRGPFFVASASLIFFKIQDNSLKNILISHYYDILPGGR